nr:MAG TPA: nucelotide kinase [Caudoviricetes sp.]
MTGILIIIYIIVIVGAFALSHELERDSNNGMESSNSNNNMDSVCGDMSNIQLCMSRKEQVNHPNHYNQGQYECIAVMESIYGIEATMNFCLLCAFKYTWRTNDKDGIQDIDKAIWYLKKYKELQERSQKQ